MRLLLATLAATLIGSAAMAAPIAAPGTEGFKVIAGGGEVIARYEGTTAAYTNWLYLDNGDGDYSNDLFIFNNQASPVGSTVNLGTFAAGTELLFRLYVTNTGYNFFTGPADRNPDGFAHNRVQSDYLAAGTTLVSFEDLFNGPFDYNDLSFTFTNTVGVPPAVVPVPAAFGLLAAALGGLALIRRKRA
jgi:hypothetical protein